QVAAYFGVPVPGTPPYHVRAFLMRDREKFKATGLLPDDLPLFENGYARGREVWLADQASDYYRRHLLLHEGTHAFMYTVLGGDAPTWYIEGMAELLGGHRWDGMQLTLGYFPRQRDEVPYWGRTKLLREAYARDRVN